MDNISRLLNADVLGAKMLVVENSRLGYLDWNVVILDYRTAPGSTPVLSLLLTV